MPIAKWRRRRTIIGGSSGAASFGFFLATVEGTAIVFVPHLQLGS